MRKWKNLGCMAMACLMLMGGVWMQGISVSAIEMPGSTSEPEPVERTTRAEPENIALNTNVAGQSVRDNAHYYSITTDNKNVDYEFCLVNDTPSDHRNFSTMLLEITVAAFRADGQYDHDDYLFPSKFVDPAKSRTFKQTISLKKNTRYIIQLRPFYPMATPYHFSVNQVSKTPVLKKVTAKKGKTVVKFTKTQIAQSYEVAVKKQGGSWKTYKAKKNTYTVKKLKSKKKYSVRVRSVCTVNGAKKYSAWSKVKKIKVK